MEENRSKGSLVRVGDKSIARYSNALVRRALEEIALKKTSDTLRMKEQTMETSVEQKEEIIVMPSIEELQARLARLKNFLNQVRKEKKEISKDSKIKNAHILVVDDEKLFVELIQAQLLNDGFKNIHVAYDGEEALEMMKRLGEQVQLILLDLKMPGIDGFEVMRSLTEKHHHIVGVIMVTGVNDLKTARKFMQLGTEKVIAFDYCTHPVDLEYFLPRIKEAIVFVQSKRKQINNLENN